jgi:hypothetical protein
MRLKLDYALTYIARVILQRVCGGILFSVSRSAASDLRIYCQLYQTLCCVNVEQSPLRYGAPPTIDRHRTTSRCA